MNFYTKSKWLRKKGFFSFILRFQNISALLALISQYFLPYIMVMLLAFREILDENVDIDVLTDKHGTKK